MSKFLMSRENPDGWTLEDLLTEIQNDVIRRCEKICDDRRPESRQVLQNNFEILSLLGRASELSRESTKILNSLGPAEGPRGKPRIG
ncbi:MAG: histidine kinase [Alphaproteobacteria bacterium]|nr:histidine kinase [Alphaproteobacteria bacterium]